MLIPNWPAPKNIKAFTVTKQDALADLPPLKFLYQVHGCEVIDALMQQESTQADGIYTTQYNTPCAIKTADCLAILLCNTTGTEISALHAGWRGLSKNIIAEGLKKFTAAPETIIAWLSPAICQQHYEVDDAVYKNFSDYKNCFVENRPGHWLCDIKKIATLQLQSLGVTHLFGYDYCTSENEDLFYSHRREPKNPGRLVHVIWKEETT